MRYSVPELLHSEQGCLFESQLISEVRKHQKLRRGQPHIIFSVMAWWNISTEHSSTCWPHHPWVWEQHICKVCTTYYARVNSTTGYTPFYLIFGRQPRLPVDMMYGSTLTDSQSPGEYAVRLKKQLTSTYETVQQTCKTQHERQNELYDWKIMEFHMKQVTGFGC